MTFMNTLDSSPVMLSVANRPINLSRFSLFLLLFMASSSTWALNQKPIAAAGSDQTVGMAVTIQLDGSTSHDNDGQIKKYRWQQTKGQKVTLLDAQTPIAHFVTPTSLPAKLAAQTLSFKLMVTDDRNKSATDTVSIKLIDCSAPRTVNNGICQDPLAVCTSPQVLQGNRCITPSTPLACKSPLVAIEGVCRLPTVTCTLPQVLQNGICALPVTHDKINDTAITSCSDTEHNGNRCPLSNYPGQDAEFGRDVYFNEDSDGHAGFSFRKIAIDGTVLVNTSKDWQCVQDQVTGLIWEIKSDKPGLHDQAARLTYAEAIDYAKTINTEGLCGAHDWRLPSAAELQMLVDYSVIYPGPAIDQNFFPHTPNQPHWTSTAFTNDDNRAWVVYFDDGRVFDDVRSQRYPVRLVRQGVRP